MEKEGVLGLEGGQKVPIMLEQKVWHHQELGTLIGCLCGAF